MLFLAGFALIALQGRQMAQQKDSMPSLIGPQWRPVKVDGEGLADHGEMFVQFAEDGGISGHGGCNRFFGSLESTDDGFSVGPLGSTRMACPEPIMDLEMAFIAAVQKMSSYEIENARLKIQDSRQNVVAELVVETR